jgi:hypothetical protein
VDVIVDGRAVEALVQREGGLFEGRLEGVAEGARYKFRLDATRYRPDPVSRFQPEGIHGPSVVVDPSRFVWTDGEFAGHAPGELVFYEIHIGAFTPAGTFEAIIPHLSRLADLGVTALQLMPIAEFPGSRPTRRTGDRAACGAWSTRATRAASRCFSTSCTTTSDRRGTASPTTGHTSRIVTPRRGVRR